MILIDNHFSTDPYFNLALEEYLFKELDDEILMLWRNEPSIIVGKHQNALAEINFKALQESPIPVVRRLSGGGTVYHDLGNLNFTYIRTAEKDRIIDFDRFVQPVIKGLAEMGISAHQGKRNDIRVGDKKISGNAEHTCKRRVLHHGTLLFDTDLNRLIDYLRINPLKYKDKAIKSVQSAVVNLKELLDDMDMDVFRRKLLSSLKSYHDIKRSTEIRELEQDKIERLQREKYELSTWNFGYSPTYTFTKLIESDEEELEIELQVKKGLIEEARILDMEEQPEWIKYLIGNQHDPYLPARWPEWRSIYEQLF